MSETSGEMLVNGKPDIVEQRREEKVPFTFLGISTHPEGFKINTDKVLGRTEGNASNHLDPDRLTRIAQISEALKGARARESDPDEIAKFEEDLRRERRELGPNATRLRDATRSEVQHQVGDRVRDARAWFLERRGIVDEARMSAAPTDVIANLDRQTESPGKVYTRLAGAYTLNMMGKTGIADLRIDEASNTATVDVVAIPFKNYQVLSDPENRPETKALGRILGTAAIIRTVDRKLIVQLRGIRNKFYKGIPGASAAGLNDVTIDDHSRGEKIRVARTRMVNALQLARDSHMSGAPTDVTESLDADARNAMNKFNDSTDTPVREKGKPDPIDNTSLEKNMKKEVKEELGIDLEEMRAVALVADNIKEHDEVVYLADSIHTFEDILAKARAARRSRGQSDPEMNFVAIQATPQAIEILLTKVKCPLPPTHAAAYLAAGYSIILNDQSIPEELKLSKANEWKDRVEREMKENYREIDRIVNEFNGSRGYNPALLPEEQGLPKDREELERYELIA